MSTTAESAQQWLSSQPRSASEIEQVLEKLYQRLEKFTDQPEVDLSGSEAAIDVLEQALLALQPTVEPAPTSQTAPLDVSDLGEAQVNIAAAPKSADEKRQRFESLKAQLNSFTER